MYIPQDAIAKSSHTTMTAERRTSQLLMLHARASTAEKIEYPTRTLLVPADIKDVVVMNLEACASSRLMHFETCM
jgi:hypothetical protein